MKPLEMLITKALPAILSRIENIESRLDAIDSQLSGVVALDKLEERVDDIAARLTTLENQPGYGPADDGINPSAESRIDAELLDLSDRIAACAHNDYSSVVADMKNRLDDMAARLQTIEHPVRTRRTRKTVKPLPPDDTDPDTVATINYALGAASGDENMAVTLAGLDDTQGDLVRIIKKADPAQFAEWLSNHPSNGSNVPLAYRTAHYSEV